LLNGRGGGVLTRGIATLLLIERENIIMNAEYHGNDENREIKKFNLAINKANLMKVWDNRFFNVFVN